MSEEEDLNSAVVRIETDYRTSGSLWGRRLRFIPAAEVRSRKSSFPEGTKVNSALIGRLFLWPVYPYGFDRSREAWYRTERCPGCAVERPAIEMSVDHLKPVSRGGLEFDRSNLRFLCLSCNVSRGNRTLRLGDGRPENHPPLERFA